MSKLKLNYGPAKLGKKPPKMSGGFAYKPKDKLKGGVTTMPHNPKPGSPPGGKPKGPKAPRGPFPTGQLSYKDFLREMHAAENLQFDPLQRQLGREENASNFRRTQEDPAWFATYKQNVADLGKQTQDAYSAAEDRIQNFSNQAGAQDQAGRTALTQQLQADAERRGTTVDPSVIANGQNAQAARSTLAATLHGTIAGQGANQAAYMNNRQSIGDQLQREAQQKELSWLLGKHQDDLRNIAKDRGDFRTKYRADTRDAERKYGLAQQTIKGENKRANLSSRTSTANNIRSTSTSAANNKRTTSTSARGQDISHADRVKSQHNQNIRDRKNRGERRRHNQQSEKNAAKGNKGKGKKL